MTFHLGHEAAWNDVNRTVPKLPAPLDSETAALLRAFLVPILEGSSSWGEMRSALLKKGYDVKFRMGRFVLVSIASGEAVCTGKALGVPLRALSSRLGRPMVKAHPDGRTGELLDKPVF